MEHTIYVRRMKLALASIEASASALGGETAEAQIEAAHKTRPEYRDLFRAEAIALALGDLVAEKSKAPAKKPAKRATKQTAASKAKV